MTRGEIETALKTYPETTARLTVLNLRAAAIEHKIICARAALDDPSGVGAVVIDGMPHAHSNGSMVERQVIKRECDTAEIVEMQHELAKVQEQAYHLGREVSTVEAWVRALSERERFAVKLFYFEGLFWNMIRRRYQDEYKMPLSDRQAKQLRSQALEKIERVSG